MILIRSSERTNQDNVKFKNLNPFRKAEYQNF